MPFDIEGHKIWRQIDSSAYLFLNELTEPGDNALKIVLDEAVANQAKTGPKTFPGGIDFGESTPYRADIDLPHFRSSMEELRFLLCDGRDARFMRQI
jgi:hypothetical protein